MDGCLANLIKYLLTGTNLLVFLMSGIVLGFGIWAKVDVNGQAFNTLLEAAEDNSNLSIKVYATAATIVIVASAAVLIITFLGCCGALKENRCMLGLYFAILLSLFVIMTVGAVVGYLPSEIKDPMLSSIKKYDSDTSDLNSQTITKAWDQIQKDLQCCGVNGYEDWTANPSVVGVPESCCTGRADNVEDCKKNPENVPEDKMVGCLEKIETYVEKNTKLLGGIAVAVIIVMFLNMIFAFAMCTMAH